MSEPKNQHIIPQCYLKQFVDLNIPSGQDPYVWIFEKGSKKGKKKAPKNILKETDFYTLVIEGGEKNYTIEKTLSQIESEYALVFDNKIKSKKPLNNYEHVVLCAFVAAMLLRTFKHKENIESMYDQIIEHVEAMEEAHGIKPKKSLAMKKDKENAHKITLIQLLPTFVNTLARMNLAFLCSNKKGAFITSDAPCYLFNSRLQWEVQHLIAPAFGQKHVEIRMPLSPEISLCFSWAYNIRGYLEVDTDWILELNRSLLGHSHQYFIANSPVLKKRWFSRYPLNPTFIGKFFFNTIKRNIKFLQRYFKYNV